MSHDTAVSLASGFVGLAVGAVLKLACYWLIDRRERRRDRLWNVGQTFVIGPGTRIDPPTLPERVEMARRHIAEASARVQSDTHREQP